MIKRVILCFIITFLCGSGIMAQTTDSIVQPEVYYSSPKTYEIGGIEVTGIADHYDPETLVQLAGLKVGQEIKLPGDEITKAIKRLYSNGLFSDVGFFIDRVVDGKAYLILHLQERQKLSKINYIGLKKSEENKIKEKINPLPGTQVTDNMITNLKHIVEKHFKEKGFYNISIKALQRDDPEKDNFVILDVIVERNNKIKIQDIVINGNKEIKASVLKRAMKKTREKSLVNFFKSSKYIEASYEDDKYNLLDKYNEKGYRDAMILSDSVVQVSPKRVKIYINVEESK